MKISKEMIKGSTGTLILTLLSREPLYGYEIIKQLDVGSGGIFTLKEGTLYPLLHSMESEQWVESFWTENGGRKRKYYRITDSGLKQLEEKRTEWRVFRQAVDTVLGEGGRS